MAFSVMHQAFTCLHWNILFPLDNLQDKGSMDSTQGNFVIDESTNCFALTGQEGNELGSILVQFFVWISPVCL